MGQIMWMSLFILVGTTSLIDGFVDLAADATATASSQYKWFGAKLALDGITSTNFCNNSCMHTLLDKSPWLRIDLGVGDKKHLNYIQEVIVYNRRDCCSKRANNMTVTMGNDPDGNGAVVCGTRMDMDIAVGRFLCRHPQAGRYIHIRIPGPQYLHLCEVKVFGERRLIQQKLSLTNSKITSISESFFFPRENMIDGDFSTRFETSGDENRPWIILTMPKKAVIYQVRAYLAEGSFYLDKTVVTVGNDSQMTAIGTFNEGEEITVGKMRYYKAESTDGVSGTNIKLQKSDDYYYSIAEMLVYGVYSTV